MASCAADSSTLGLKSKKDCKLRVQIFFAQMGYADKSIPAFNHFLSIELKGIICPFIYLLESRAIFVLLDWMIRKKK